MAAVILADRVYRFSTFNPETVAVSVYPLKGARGLWPQSTSYCIERARRLLATLRTQAIA
jgi:hypothetical protein